jgi:hypothetical protein
VIARSRNASTRRVLQAEASHAFGCLWGSAGARRLILLILMAVAISWELEGPTHDSRDGFFCSSVVEKLSDAAN